jgi:hypothetical protein
VTSPPLCLFLKADLAICGQEPQFLGEGPCLFFTGRIPHNTTCILIRQIYFFSTLRSHDPNLHHDLGNDYLRVQGVLQGVRWQWPIDSSSACEASTRWLTEGKHGHSASVHYWGKRLALAQQPSPCLPASHSGDDKLMADSYRSL